MVHLAVEWWVRCEMQAYCQTPTACKGAVLKYGKVWAGQGALIIYTMCVSHSVVSNSVTPMDCSPPGSSVHEIFQARILEWVAISFSNKGFQYYHSQEQFRISIWYTLSSEIFLEYNPNIIWLLSGLLKSKIRWFITE